MILAYLGLLSNRLECGPEMKILACNAVRKESSAQRLSYRLRGTPYFCYTIVTPRSSFALFNPHSSLAYRSSFTPKSPYPKLFHRYQDLHKDSSQYAFNFLSLSVAGIRSCSVPFFGKSNVFLHNC